MAFAEAAHAALLSRVAPAEARVQAAAIELRKALVEAEALARLVGRSDGEPIGVCIPPIGDGPEATFFVTTADIYEAMSSLLWLAEPNPGRPTAQILPFQRTFHA